VGAFVKGELHLSWMQMFPSPFMPFYSYFFIAFFFQEANQGTLPGVVISGDSVTCYPPLSGITRRLCLEVHRS
jgi:hypothetical protein